MMQGESKHPAKKMRRHFEKRVSRWSLRLAFQPNTEMEPVFGTVGMVGTGVASQLTKPQLCRWAAVEGVSARVVTKLSLSWVMGQQTRNVRLCPSPQQLLSKRMADVGLCHQLALRHVIRFHLQKKLETFRICPQILEKLGNTTTAHLPTDALQLVGPTSPPRRLLNTSKFLCEQQENALA